MAKKTIIKKWAEDTHNKYELSEEQVKTGIVRLGNIVSNQLNAVANRADIMIDLLQRCSAWNVDKTYQQGDICMVSIYYKRPSDAQHKYYIMFLISTKNDNKEIPLINNGATSFTRNDNLTTPCFTITANSEIILSNFVNGTGWAFADSTCGDLTNCVNLSVSEVAHFKGNTSFDGNVVANSNIDLAGNLTTQGHLELAGTANFNNSVTLNGLVNTATTPANTAFENEIVTAKWVRDFYSNDTQKAYPRYCYFTDTIFELDELTPKHLILKVPLLVLSIAIGFMFQIYTIDDNGNGKKLVYLSKRSLETTDTLYTYDRDNFQKLPLNIGANYKNGYWLSNTYNGSHLQNGKWIDFEYSFKRGIEVIYAGQQSQDIMNTDIYIGDFTKNREYGNARYKIILTFLA